ncbi:MAG: PhnA-like protein [Alphaproteobacteria bacterium]
MAVSGDTPRMRGDADAPHWSDVTPAEDMRTIMINRVSWGAVAAGVAVALVTQALLNILGVGIGAATIDPASGDSPSAGSLAMGSAIWWALAGIVAAFAGGAVAGRLSGRPKRATAGWHGLISWAATTLIVFWMVASAVGGIVGGAFTAAGNALGGLGRAAGTAIEAAAPDMSRTADPFAGIERAVREATGGNDPAILRDAAVAAVRAAVSGDPAQVEQARERAAQALVQAQTAAGGSLTIEDARAQVAAYERRYRAAVDEAKRRATEAADAGAKVVSRSALLSFIAFAIGAFAAWIGGMFGTVEPTVTPMRRLFNG